MNIAAFIFARGGSKGLPGKNILPFGGKPLISWAIDQAKEVSRIQRIIVSTDCPQIAEIARLSGAEVPFLRPENIAQDSSPEWLAWQHALTFLENEEGIMPDIMVSIPTTSPLRKPVDIENCLNEFLEGDVDAVITVSAARRSPYFNMVKLNSDGMASLVIPPYGEKIIRRQDSPLLYDITTVAYVVNSKFIINKNSIFEGRVKAIQIPAERAIDIDTLLDFQIAEFLLQKNQVNELT
jgi:N-acylneuraminate cytidylyltransferase